MAVSHIDPALITQFSDKVHVDSQQMQARLKPYIKTIPVSADNAAYDGLGTVEAREIYGQYEPVVFDSIQHARRQIARRRFVVTLAIDASNVRGMLTDPTSGYSDAVVFAMARQFDRVNVEACFADVKTGRNFDTTVTYANDGGHTVNATAGTTYEKLLELKTHWTNNEVGNDAKEKFIFLGTGDEQEALMKETELISGDFSRQFVVDRGEIVKALGIDLLFYGGDVPNPILDVNSTTRDCVAMSTRGLCCGISKKLGMKIENRPDLHETEQLVVTTEMGSTRTEGALIQKFQTTVL